MRFPFPRTQFNPHRVSLCLSHLSALRISVSRQSATTVAVIGLVQGYSVGAALVIGASDVNDEASGDLDGAAACPPKPQWIRTAYDWGVSTGSLA